MLKRATTPPQTSLMFFSYTEAVIHSLTLFPLTSYLMFLSLIPLHMTSFKYLKAVMLCEICI